MINEDGKSPLIKQMWLGLYYLSTYHHFMITGLYQTYQQLQGKVQKSSWYFIAFTAFFLIKLIFTKSQHSQGEASESALMQQLSGPASSKSFKLLKSSHSKAGMYNLPHITFSSEEVWLYMHRRCKLLPAVQ